MSASLSALPGSALVLCLALGAPLTAHASCESTVDEWAARGPQPQCSLTAKFCPADGVVLEVDAPPTRLTVEVRRTGPGFRTVRGVVLSPVAQVADWSKVTPGLQAAFERLCACVERHPEPFPWSAGPPTAGPASGAAPQTPPPAALPWRLLLGLLLSAAALALGRARPSRAALLEALAACVALPLVLAAGWRLLVGSAYFHQNGQGPIWVGYALGPAGGSPYGPGFGELFGVIARAFAQGPDGAIFQAVALLCAFTIAPVAWAAARAAGLGAPARWAVALSVGLLPMLARTAQSESYYAVLCALSFLAAAPLALVPLDRERFRLGPRFVGAVLGAGLIVAQAARVHPIGWTPAALVPLALLARPVSPRATLAYLACAGAGIGLTVGAFSGAAMLEVMNGEMVGRWGALGQRSLLMRGALPAGLAAATALVLALARARPLACALALAAVPAMAATSQVMGAEMPAIFRAYQLLWLAGALGPLLGLRRAAAPLAAAGWLTATALSLGPARTLPTDAAEQRLLIAWRRTLPRPAVVFHLARAGQRVLAVPLFGAQRPFRLDAAQGVPPVPTPGSFYYRASLCDSAEGAALCAALERDWPLKAVQQAELPAVPSKPDLPYLTPTVRVTLYEVTGTNSAAP
ncbi:MAG: hypothetical protein IPJ65_15295 [Archangiaceae bacterium]|nr:hypothetical protein [Archangiaceae bacterium]